MGMLFVSFWLLFPCGFATENDREYFILIGPAYVDMYMDGRVAKELDEGKYTLREFQIRWIWK